MFKTLLSKLNIGTLFKNLNTLLNAKKKYKYINRRAMGRTIRRVPPRGLSGREGTPRTIISLTSIPSRMSDMHFTVYSLMDQTLPADAIILYLGSEFFPKGERGLPKSLLQFKKYGLQIRFVKDLKPYTKFVYSLADYPESFIVTADDDIFYPRDWLEKLWRTHEEHPECIIAHRAHWIKFADDGQLLPYKQWGYTKGRPIPSFKNFLTGVGGVLYPPHALHGDAGCAEKFTRLAEFADDIWFWASAVRNNTKVCCVPGGYPKPTFVNIVRELRLSNSAPTLAMKNNSQNANDRQLAAVLGEYPEILECLRNERE